LSLDNAVPCFIYRGAFADLHNHAFIVASVLKVPRKSKSSEKINIKNKNSMDKQYNEDGFIPKHGVYQWFINYQKSEIIYDGTFYFAHKYLRW